MPINTRNIVLEKSLAFALSIINFCETLELHNKYVISHQLLKSGTSIGANINEAQNSESRVDFIHKFKIAAKEAEETKYWLLLCQQAASYPYEEQLLHDLSEILRLINSIINSAKKSV